MASNIVDGYMSRLLENPTPNEAEIRRVLKQASGRLSRETKEQCIELFPVTDELLAKLIPIGALKAIPR